MRSILSVVLGLLVAAATYWAGAVLALLLLRGLPLGSAGGAVTSAEVSVHLGLGFTASLLGAALAARSSRGASSIPAAMVGVVAATGAFIGFGKPASAWPSWFPIAMAAACLIGAAGAAFATSKRG